MELCSYTNTNVNATTNKSNEQIEEKNIKYSPKINIIDKPSTNVKQSYNSNGMNER